VCIYATIIDRLFGIHCTYEGLTIILSSVSPAALRIAETQLVRIPDVIADKITLLSSQDCEPKIYKLVSKIKF